MVGDVVRVVVQAHVVDADEGARGRPPRWRSRRGVLAVQAADETRSAGSCSSRTMSRSCRASAPKRMETGTPVFLAARAAPRNRLSSVGGHAGAVGDGGDDAGGGAALHPGNHHALGDLLAEEVGELLGRPRGRRVGLRRQEVAAEHLPPGPCPWRRRCARRSSGTAPRRASGRGRGTCPCCRRSSARRARGSPSSFAARASKISARSMEMSEAYWAPGTTDSRASWTATTPSSAAGTGPRTVLTVCPVGAWNASPLSTGVV